MTQRPDLELIARLIPRGSRVLDLGCGDGWLLRRLQRDGCTGTGVEISAEPFHAALSQGVDVLDLDINTDLGEFREQSFDVVVLSGTLQNVQRPRQVLREMERIAGRAVVSMPNFASWRNRLQLLRGRMPVSRALPFQWYNTPNLHYTSLADLEPLFADLGWRIDKRVPLNPRGRPISDAFANLRASSAVYALRGRARS